MLKYEILNARQKKELIKLINHCEECGRKEKLTLHRINRGYMGGAYTIRNVKVVCQNCSKLYHFAEPGIRKR